MGEVELGVFNKETWERILQHLPSPEDKLRVVKSVGIEAAFKEELPSWEFAAVLPILLKAFRKGYYFDNELKSALVNCRLVSPCCTSEIDKYIKAFWNEPDFSSYPSVLPSPLLLSDPDMILKFTEKIILHPGNRSPLFIRVLTASVSGEADAEQSCSDAISRLLETVGPHLYTFELHTNSFPSVEALTQFLQNILALLPNLRCFRYVPNPTALLEETPEAFQPPALPHLKKLSLMGNKSVQQLVRHIPFQRYFTQLTSFQIHFIFWDKAYEVPKLFPNLQFLSIRGIECVEEGVQTQVAELIMKLDAPQLKLLTLQMEAKARKPNMYGIVYNFSKEADLALAYMKRMGLFFLKGKYTLKQWKSQEGILFQNATRKLLCLKIYNELEVKVKPIRQQKEHQLKDPTLTVSEMSLTEPEPKRRSCVIM